MNRTQAICFGSRLNCCVHYIYLSIPQSLQAQEQDTLPRCVPGDQMTSRREQHTDICTWGCLSMSWSPAPSISLGVEKLELLRSRCKGSLPAAETMHAKDEGGSHSISYDGI